MGLGYIDVPLAENDLLNEHLVTYRCIYIKVQYIDQIRASIEGSGNLEVNYKDVVIHSSNREHKEPYNFYNAICHEGWWGYRTLEQCSFRTFCGAMNEMQIGSPTSELKILDDVETDIKMCGFHSIAHCFNPAILLEWFSYSPLAPEFCGSLPACYTKLPFEFRNDKDDEPPTDPMRNILIEFLNPEPASPMRNGGGSQSNGADTPMRRTGPGTGQSPGRRRPQPSPLGSRNADDDDAVAPPLKRNRRSKFIIDEASGDEDMDEVRASVSKTPANATLTLSCHYPHFSQEEEIAETAEDKDFIDDGSNHSQGDDYLLGPNDLDPHPYDLGLDYEQDLDYQQGRCMNVLGQEDDGTDIICGDRCNPAEQMCHYCTTHAHRFW